ncbi:MAG: hypothetical protein HKO57_06990, partial [Akkermansiaceae bacterium]|nr:hypothetical protein [Akkermansiaceae bacterium]
AILNGNDPLARYDGSLDFLLRELETFNHEGEDLFAALKTLAAARRTPASVKARLNWVMTILPLCPPAAELASAKKPLPEDHFNSALPAATALVNALPYEGSRAVITGWMNFNAGDSGVFNNFVTPGREAKAAPLLQALRRLPAGQAREILGMTVAQGKGRKAADYLFSRDELRALVRDLPQVFNSLQAPDISLFDKTLTPEMAGAMAPNLARNPHAQAAMVRAWARPERNYSAAADQMMKSEMWRFNDIKAVTHGLWHSGMFERDVEHDVPIKKYGKLDARYQQLTKQVAKEAKSNERLAAFNALQKDLLSANPGIPGANVLWDELFAQAPDADKVRMIRTLTANLAGEREYLLHRALAKSQFGKGGAMPWKADVYDNHFRYHQKGTRETAADLITHLEGLVRAQMKAGNPSETIFGMWLHSIDPRKPEAVEVIKELLATPSYAKLDDAYQRVAADAQHFGRAALTAGLAATDPQHLSRELVALPEGATGAQVEAALKAAVDRVVSAPDPVTVLGLGKVAAAPEWSGGTRALVLSLFEDNAAVGAVPARQGYEPLIQRLTAELAEAGSWGTLEPCAAGLWHAAAATDDDRYYRGGEALTQFAEAALEAGASSVAMTIARSGTRSVAGRAFAARSEPNLTRMNGRLRQVTGKAATDIGALEIPVAENDPSYPLYKSNAEHARGNLDSAWELYEEHADQLVPVLRELTVEYGLWLLRRNTEAGEQERAEELVKELTIWSRQAEGTFSLEQDARLKIAYAHLAFRKGALPTARAWFRKVADAAEYQGSLMHLEAALGSVMVDRVSKNYSAALTELDKLMQLPNPEFRMRIRYARAEVLMDQENYAEALGEVEAVLRRQPKHPDALILRGKIHYEMRKLVEASEIELGPSQDDTVLVPGEAVKINLRDPTLRVSGVGADIEVEIWAKSGDRERVLLHQLGDSKEKFRAEVPTALGPPTPGDKILQILGRDEIRFGYSKRFRAMMDDLPPDPDLVIGVASDARLDLTAGAFPAREGERRLAIEELGLTTAQAALGTRAVRPGNPVYLRVTDPDQSITPGLDEITVSLQASSGDEIRRLVLKETAPFSGEFQAIVPTTGAQALAFASESAPGRDPNMAISSRDYPGWQGEVGDKEKARTFGIDLNDNVALKEMTVASGGGGQELTHFVVQTSMNGSDWITRARYPAAEDAEAWDGRPHLSSFPTYRGGIAVSAPEGRALPEDWLEKMELGTAKASVGYLAAHVTGLSAEKLPVVNTGHPGYSGLVRYRALFYQPAAAIRRFQLTGYPATDEKGNI